MSDTEDHASWSRWVPVLLVSAGPVSPAENVEKILRAHYTEGNGPLFKYVVDNLAQRGVDSDAKRRVLKWHAVAQ